MRNGNVVAELPAHIEARIRQLGGQGSCSARFRTAAAEQ
jgi:hypothetical protein